MEWIYVAPHLDDVALSCGGLLWDQSRRGEAVRIWTVCAGDPPGSSLSPLAQALHDRWGYGIDAARRRRDEDRRAVRILGATPVHLTVPDGIYRREGARGPVLYPGEDQLFGGLHPKDLHLLDALAQEFSDRLPAMVQLAGPLALGGHVDHRLTRSVLERLGRKLWYYADYPYLLQHPDLEDDSKSAALLAGLEPVHFPVSSGGLRAWEQAVAAHNSQISTFWRDTAEMKAAIRAYCGQTGGVRLWRPAEGRGEREGARVVQGD